MNAHLNEINKLYLKIQGQYIDDTIQEKDDSIDISKVEKFSEIYNIALEKFNKIAPLLTPYEIVEGYKQGSNLLQKNLSGRMSLHFNDLYTPVMIDAIKNDHQHTAYLFLQTLADNLDNDITSIVQFALQSKSKLTRETALNVAEQLNLFELTEEIQEICFDVEPEISSLAKQIINDWDRYNKK